MVELLSVIFIIFLGISFYINENTLHKNKIKFDLLEDRTKKVREIK